MHPNENSNHRATAKLEAEGKMHNVFVYGTLKSGYSNNVLLKGSTFKSTGITLRLFTVLSSGFPVAFVTERPKHRLSGEVYQVDDKILAQLDRLESNGSMYKRRRVVINTPTGTEVCWMYIGVYRHWAYSFKHMPEISVVNGIYRWGPNEPTEQSKIEPPKRRSRIVEGPPAS